MKDQFGVPIEKYLDQMIPVDRTRELQRRLDAIEALHGPDGANDCSECGYWDPGERIIDPITHPCPTVRLARGESL